MKKIFVNLICLILLVFFVSCNKTEESVETTIDETNTTKVDIVGNEEETTVDVPKTILWDSIDGADFDGPLLYFSIEKELLDKIKNATDKTFSIRLVFWKNLDNELTSIDIFKICKYLSQDLKYNTNYKDMSDIELNAEIEMNGTKNMLFYLSKEQIYELLKIEWPGDFRLCIMEQETEFEFFDDDFIHYAIEPDLSHKLQILQDTTNKLFPISLMMYKDIPCETSLSIDEEVRLLRYMWDELKFHTNYEDMSDDELIASINSGGFERCFYLSKEQIYELIEIDWPKDFMLFILWEDTDILR